MNSETPAKAFGYTYEEHTIESLRDILRNSNFQKIDSFGKAQMFRYALEFEKETKLDT